MKKILIITTFFMASQGFAQGVKKEILGTEAAQMVRGAKTVAVSAQGKAADFVELESSARFKKEDFSTWANQYLGLKNSSFTEANQISDALGYTHYRLSQHFNGVPVVGAEYILHTKNGLVESMNGVLYNDIQPVNSIAIATNTAFSNAKLAMGITETISENLEIKAQLAAKLEKDITEFDAIPALVLLPIETTEGTNFHYAYRCDVFSLQPYARYEVFVDASTGKVLEQYSLIHTDKKEGIARTKYSGTQTIMVDSITTGADAGKFRLIEVNRHDTTGVNIETLNAENKSSQQVFQNGGKDFLDDDNDWNNVNANYDEAATDAHWGAETTYDYFLSQHNRDSYDNKGSKLLSYVHINEKGYFNASWNGLFMVYGDGSGKPLTSLDVCGHELAHGVTGNSARLIYARESGALNESFSDIFGNAIEKVYRSNQFNWKVGEDFSALRDMSNPKAFNDPQTYKGSNWKYADRDCTPSETNDQCGVHSNSGVQNFWFYLMVDGGSGKNDKGDNYTVTGIGVEDAAKIAYRNLSVYLGQSSTYFDAAYYSIKAAADLFGDSSQAYKSTVDAWYAVGVIERPYSDTLVCDFGVESVPCNLSETIYFINKSNGGTSYLWDFGDGTTSALANPSKKYTQAGSYNVKLTITKGAETKVLERTKFINFYTNEPKTASCVNKANTPNTQLGILNFSFADINYNSESASEGQLMNFTCIRATTQAGRSLPMTITTPAGQMTYARVWIDYNNDGTFTENELAMKSDSTIENHGALVHIPADAVLNTPLRIRAISSKYGANTPDNPCATVRFGQVEEYTVVLDKVSSVKNNAFASLKIYPNPVSNQALTIEAESTMNTIQIFNQIGAKVLEMNNVQQSKVTLSNLDLAPGMYMVQVQSDDKIAVNKIVIK